MFDLFQSIAGFYVCLVLIVQRKKQAARLVKDWVSYAPSFAPTQRSAELLMIAMAAVALAISVAACWRYLTK